MYLFTNARMQNVPRSNAKTSERENLLMNED